MASSPPPALADSMPCEATLPREVVMKEYRGEKIIVRYDEKLCIHAGECVEGLPAVFDVNKRPWINADGASVEDIQRQIARCPSGALTCELVKPKE